MRTHNLMLAVIPFMVAFSICAQAQSAEPSSFKSLDANQDDWITFEEFDSGEIDFKALDANNDEALSKSEYRARLDEWNAVKTASSLVTVLAGARSFFLRHDEMPTSVDTLIKNGHFDQADIIDPWGNPLSVWMAKEFPQPKRDEDGNIIEPEGFVPWKGLQNQINHQEILPYYSVRSAGADGKLGTADDIYRTNAGAGMPVSDYQRRRAILNDGKAYHFAARAWVNEQAFRLWTAIAEKEIADGEQVTSLEGLNLPYTTFPEGKAVDLFGREFKIINVKGLRALSLEKGEEDWQSDFSMRESEFAANLLVRVQSSRSGSSYQWNIRQLFSAAKQIRDRNGRLPLSLSELRTSPNVNQWTFRDNYGGTLIYLSLNDGRNLMVCNLGSDQEVGGTGSARDQCYYIDLENATDQPSALQNLQWQGQDRTRFAALEKVVKAASGEKEDERKPASSEEIRKIINNLEDDADPEWVARLHEMLEQAIEREEMEKAREEMEKALKEEAAEDDEDGVNFQQPPPPRVKPVPIDPVEVEEKTEDEEAKPEVDQPEGEKNAEEETFELTDEQKMIPIRLYSAAEAQFMGLVPANDYEFNINYYRVQRLSYALNNYYRSRIDSEHPPQLPFGNLKLSNGSDFMASDEARNWEDNYSYYEDQIQHYIVAKLDAEKNNRRVWSFTMGLLQKNADMPIFCNSYTQRGNIQLFALEKEQPKGWREMVAAVNGKKSDEKEGPSKVDEPSKKGEPEMPEDPEIPEENPVD